MVITEEITKPMVTGLRGDYDELFMLIKENHYNGVELMVKNPFKVDFDLIYKIAKKYNLKIPMICTGEFFGEDHISFADPDINIRKEAINRTKELMKFAYKLGANINIGRLRGRFYPEVPKEKTMRWVKDGLKEVARTNENVNLLIEPICRLYTNFIITTEDGLSFIKELEQPNIQLMLDIDHMTNENEDISESIKKASSYLKHVHICDKDHKPLGEGNYDFDIFLNALKEINYKGFITVETFVSNNYLKDIKNSYNIIQKCLNNL